MIKCIKCIGDFFDFALYKFTLYLLTYHLYYYCYCLVFLVINKTVTYAFLLCRVNI